MAVIDGLVLAVAPAVVFAAAWGRATLHARLRSGWAPRPRSRRSVQ